MTAPWPPPGLGGKTSHLPPGGLLRQAGAQPGGPAAEAHGPGQRGRRTCSRNCACFQRWGAGFWAPSSLGRRDPAWSAPAHLSPLPGEHLSPLRVWGPQPLEGPRCCPGLPADTANCVDLALNPDAEPSEGANLSPGDTGGGGQAFSFPARSGSSLGAPLSTGRPWVTACLRQSQVHLVPRCLKIAPPSSLSVASFWVSNCYSSVFGPGGDTARWVRAGGPLLSPCSFALSGSGCALPWLGLGAEEAGAFRMSGRGGRGAPGPQTQWAQGPGNTQAQ